MLKLAQTDRPTDRPTDQQTDQQTNRQGKNNMSPTTIVGDIKRIKSDQVKKGSSQYNTSNKCP
ncbi:hypothetical protein DPMN_115575 [Dreissena polymorpha]|uniref:Uncharacterized protein n=1 Tax=Dreissena polymorpha TaxID=45954 RepID=A0A9D4QTH3_DREPO|nr:hypothetical protein DPMN_115575 [Dreissena polymorpha]